MHHYDVGSQSLRQLYGFANLLYGIFLAAVIQPRYVYLGAKRCVYAVDLHRRGVKLAANQIRPDSILTVRSISYLHIIHTALNQRLKPFILIRRFH